MKEESMNVTALNFIPMNLGRQEVKDGGTEKRLIPNYPFISMEQNCDATRLKLTASTIPNQPLLRALLY